MVLVSIFVSSPDTHSERRIDSDLLIEQLKAKLIPITGIPSHFQVLTLYRSAEFSDTPLAVLNDDSRTLASYGLSDFNCIKVDNTDPTARPGEFTDLTAVDKFELTQEEYAARPDTVLSHLKANRLGRFAEVPTPITFIPPPPALVPTNIEPGTRCEVRSSEESLAKLGTVRFVGTVDIGRGGVWVGIELDEPTGKGDGSVEGKRYFTCLPKHAVFVRPEKVTVGDFPEEDLLVEDNNDDEI